MAYRDMDAMNIESHRLDRYRAFAAIYDIQELERLVELYEIDDLFAFLPSMPTAEEKQALRELIGVTGVPGYMDFRKSNNTFELIMQWRERTGRLDDGFRLRR
jgi:hypothetical protein